MQPYSVKYKSQIFILLNQVSHKTATFASGVLQNEKNVNFNDRGPKREGVSIIDDTCLDCSPFSAFPAPDRS